MHIHHILARIDKRASGLTYAVPGICSALDAVGVKTTLHVSSPGLEAFPFDVCNYPKWPLFKNVGISPAMFRALDQLQGPELILHNHSLWTLPSLLAGNIAGKRKLRMVFSPHGTLSPEALERSRWKKRLFWTLGQKRSLENAICFHATSQAEIQHIRVLGFQQPAALIPLGLTLPSTYSRHSGPKFQALFLARLHPHKGIERLIMVWNKICYQFPDWELVIAGPEDLPGYANRLHRLAGSNKSISFVGAVYGETKQKLFNTSDLYILPTLSENFGHTIAEALGAGIPVIITKGAPWSEVEKLDCGWWINNTLDDLANSLVHAMSLDPTTRRAMGLRGRDLIRSQYSWEETAIKFKELYQWIITGSEMPEWLIK